MDDMEIYEVEKRTAQLLTSLLDIWEGSVRATHHFLSDAEIDRIREYVPQALTGVKHLIVVKKCLRHSQLPCPLIHEGKGFSFVFLYCKILL